MSTTVPHYLVSDKSQTIYDNPKLNASSIKTTWKLYIDKERKTQVGKAISFTNSLKTGENTYTNFVTISVTHYKNGIANTSTTILQKNNQYLPFAGKLFGGQPKNVNLNAHYTATQIGYNNGQRILKVNLTTIS